jgi:hypothetical protein
LQHLLSPGCHSNARYKEIHESRVIMYQTELKIQPKIHLERKAGYRRGKYRALHSKCIVGCIFNSIGLITNRESPYILKTISNRFEHLTLQSVVVCYSKITLDQTLHLVPVVTTILGDSK